MNLVRKKILFAHLALASAAILSGCGTYQAMPNQSQASTKTPSTPTGTSSTTSTGATTIATSISGSANPTQTYRVGTYGYNSATVTVYTRTVLKVRFTPGVQDQTVVGSGFSPEYSALGVYIGIGSVSSPTPMLTNGYNKTIAEKSQVFDLSTEFTPTCAATNTSCTTAVTITIGKPNYDYWCLTSGQFCPWSDIYSGHPWHGTLEVQTDMTAAIQ